MGVRYLGMPGGSLGIPGRSLGSLGVSGESFQGALGVLGPPQGFTRDPRDPQGASLEPWALWKTIENHLHFQDVEALGDPLGGGAFGGAWGSLGVPEVFSCGSDASLECPLGAPGAPGTSLWGPWGAIGSFQRATPPIGRHCVVTAEAGFDS